jgi:hypothetical protein
VIRQTRRSSRTDEAQTLRRSLVMLLLISWVLATPSAQSGAAGPDPFEFFRPAVVVTDGERRQLARGDPIARVVPAQHREVMVFAAVPVKIGPDRLVAWMRRVAAFKKSPYVLAIQRFSDPPRIEDLAALNLDHEDLEAIRDCRPGDCGLKLAGAEMEMLRRAATGAGADWKPALDRAFREVVLERVQAYRGGGHAALKDYDDRREPVSLDARFAALLGHIAFLTLGLPQFTDALARYPSVPAANIESFLYWSKEGLSGKPVVSATHVSIVRHDDGVRPEVLVAGKGIFATHYVTASIGLTALMRGPDGKRYLVYLNRSEVDVLGGFFGGVARMFMERRLKSEASDILRGLRTRLESGEPPPAG